MSIMETLAARRTYRRFAQKPVPQDVVEDMVEALRLSSCGANRQAVKLVVVQSPEMVVKVHPLVKWAGYLPPEQGTPKADKQPVMYLAVVQDSAIPGDLNTDTGIALANITLAAWDKGVGSCIMGAINKPALSELLGIAEPDKLGLELQIDDMDFDAALLSVQQGKADIAMAGVTVTDERKNVMDFSDSYATGIQSIIVPEGSDIASPDDLAGKMIGTQRGTTGYIYCSDDFGDNAVVAYDDGLTAVQALNNGQVDAVVIDNAPAKEFVAANPGLVLLDTSYAEEDYAIGMAKGNTALEDAVNAALEELKADGTLQSIVDKYITAE